jgi:hypothetical protein
MASGFLHCSQRSGFPVAAAIARIRPGPQVAGRTLMLSELARIVHLEPALDRDEELDFASFEDGRNTRVWLDDAEAFGLTKEDAGLVTLHDRGPDLSVGFGVMTKGPVIFDGLRYDLFQPVSGP